jgi:hypothetical protein
MWSTDTRWFDVAVMTAFLVAGNILFGHFEEHKAKWRRLLKVALFVGVTGVCSSLGLRWMGWALIGVAIAGAGYLHLRGLPSRQNLIANSRSEIVWLFALPRPILDDARVPPRISTKPKTMFGSCGLLREPPPHRIESTL